MDPTNKDLIDFENQLNYFPSYAPNAMSATVHKTIEDFFYLKLLIEDSTYRITTSFS